MICCHLVFLLHFSILHHLQSSDTVYSISFVFIEQYHIEFQGINMPNASYRKFVP